MAKREHPTGPIAEKDQITIRIDKELLQKARAQAEDLGITITDMVERGLVMSVDEAEILPRLTGKVRFLLASAPREQQRLIHGLAIRMVEDRVVKRSKLEQGFWELVESYLHSANTEEHAAECLKLYERPPRD